MTTPQGPRKRLPNKPSEENLRKQAKRLAAQEDLQLAAAQRRIAIEYGYRNWAELIRAVASGFVPLIPLRELVAFPQEVYPIYVGRKISINAIDAAMSPGADKRVLLVAQRDSSVAAPSGHDMYEVGTLGVVVKRLLLPDATVKILVEGKKRARVSRLVFDQEFFQAEAAEIAETMGNSVRIAPLMRSVLSAFHSYAYGRSRDLRELADSIERLDDPSLISDKIVGRLGIPLAEQQTLLESANPTERLKKILGYLEAAN
jgi:ATP-dependent Lon protease